MAMCRTERAPSDAALAVLREALPKVDERLRYEAMIYLCNLASECDRYLLVVAEQIALGANFRSDHVRLLPLAGKNAIPLLTQLLHDGDRATRLDAVRCLGQVGQRAHEAVPPLEHALQDYDTLVRTQAAIELRSIDPQRFAKPAALDGARAAREK